MPNNKCLYFYTGHGYAAVVINSSMILGRPFVPGQMVRARIAFLCQDQGHFAF